MDGVVVGDDVEYHGVDSDSAFDLVDPGRLCSENVGSDCIVLLVESCGVVVVGVG